MECRRRTCTLGKIINWPWKGYWNSINKWGILREFAFGINWFDFDLSDAVTRNRLFDLAEEYRGDEGTWTLESLFSWASSGQKGGDESEGEGEKSEIQWALVKPSKQADNFFHDIQIYFIYSFSFPQHPPIFHQSILSFSSILLFLFFSYIYNCCK